MRRLLLPFLFLGLLAGCGGKSEEHTPTADADHEGHDHEEGPHGGAITVLEGHAGHLEVIHDDDAGEVRLYVYDEDMKGAALDEAPLLNLKTDAGPLQLTGEKIADATPAGMAWSFENEALKSEPENARFRLKLGAKTYAPELTHTHE